MGALLSPAAALGEDSFIPYRPLQTAGGDALWPSALKKPARESSSPPMGCAVSKVSPHVSSSTIISYHATQLPAAPACAAPDERDSMLQPQAAASVRDASPRESLDVVCSGPLNPPLRDPFARRHSRASMSADGSLMEPVAVDGLVLVDADDLLAVDTIKDPQAPAPGDAAKRRMSVSDFFFSAGRFSISDKPARRMSLAGPAAGAAAGSSREEGRASFWGRERRD